ncbi:MAG TPA: SDR family oxidoreductase [Thermoanaerobaculia bacterium]|jgi:NAD(P)-dependent dehydrogenase (short-subunit alcohol dehydrogenase family)|nr:SDR family oxidoreductase [Thermoanaerobaculia bacterium]
MPEPKLALVTGANKGIGFEVCRQLAAQGWKVLLTARNGQAGEAACAKLRAEGGDVLFHPLDVQDPEAIERLRTCVEREFGRLDVLVNNAGVSPEQGKVSSEVDMATVREVMEVNLFGPWMLSLAFIPLMKKAGGGRIIMVSTGKASFTKLAADYPAYRVSKAALNALTVVLADELRDANIQVNAVTPGWVRTHLGGIHAPRSVEEGALGTVWLATQEGTGPTGRFFRDREEFPW